MFFQLLSTVVKANLVAKTMHSAYLCLISHVKHKKNHHLWRFKPDFPFVVESNMAVKMAIMFGDVTGLQQRHHP